MTTSLLNKTAGFLATIAIRPWMRTLDFRAAYYDSSVDPVLGEDGPRIYVFWHEYILFPLYLRGHCNLAMLLSRHRDADVLERVAGHFGFECIRGSTFRGAASAVRELLRRGRDRHLAITPDGPRGPRRRLAQGSIYLASRLGMPLVAFGLGYDRPWRARSWDRFAVPRPFSRARTVVGPAVHVPQDLNRMGIEFYRQRVERLLCHLTDEAEVWAAAGTRKVEEITVRPEAARRHSLAANKRAPVFAAHSIAATQPVPQSAAPQRLAG